MTTSSTKTTTTAIRTTAAATAATTATMSLDEASMKARSAAARAYALKSSIDFSTPPIRPSVTIPPLLTTQHKHHHSTMPTTTNTTTNTNTNTNSNTNEANIEILGRNVVHDEDYGKWLKDIVSSTGGTDTEFDDPEDAFLIDPSSIDSDDEEFQFLEDFDVEKELGNELGSLLEEDLEAAVTTLISSSSSGQQHPTPKKNTTNKSANETPPRTPLRDAAASRATYITQNQSHRLKQLMNGHYQLLVQQTVLCVRAAQRTKQKVLSGESQEDLAEILDGAVGMLQDLDQSRKDAIRNTIQLQQSNSVPVSQANGRLTRAAFSRTLQHTSAATSFDVKGLSNLAQTFHILDNSKDRLIEMQEPDACHYLLKQSGANIDTTFVPSTQDVSLLLSDPKEVFGPQYMPPATEAQVLALRKDRNQFTAAEDSLVFRGVNLYGEKQWVLISDRYLPDRSINIISQRYSKLSVLLYKAHGVKIDPKGNLETPPKHESVDRVNDEILKTIKKVSPPAIFNVHRWSVEEDLTLLKAVPILGHLWAELSTRYVPHRDRGHLRKRYQVLERRIKATVARAAKEAPKYQKHSAGLKKAQHYTRRQHHQTIHTLSTSPVTARFPIRSAASVKAASQAKHPPPSAKNNSSLKVHPTTTPLPLHRPPPKLGRPFGGPGSGGPVRVKGHVQASRGTPQGNNTTPNQLRPLFSNESDSRHQFERLVSAEDDWSQTSRFKKLLEAESSKTAAIEHFPQIDMDHNSGLSLLGDTALSQETSPIGTKERVPLISNILKHTPNASKRANSPGDVSILGTNISVSSLAPLSQCNSMPAESKLDMSPSTPSHFTPLTNCRLSPVKPFPSLKGQSDLENASFMNSIDGYEFCTFSISEKSQQAMETPSKLSMTPLDLISSRQMPFMSSDSLMQNDIEAISALNALSNSPAKCLGRRALMYSQNEIEEKKEVTPSLSASSAASEREAPPNRQETKAKRSLFETVVGKVNKKAKTKR